MLLFFLQHAWKNWVSEKGAANFVGPSFGSYIYIIVYYIIVYILYIYSIFHILYFIIYNTHIGKF